MNSLKNIELPTNRKFGAFFSIIFLIITIYCFLFSSTLTVIIFGSVFFIFIIATILSPKLLTPLNKLWMRIGQILGMIISPFVMGMIYFLFFAPLAVFFKLINRDYLKLKFDSKVSYWVERVDKEIDHKSFKNQF